MAFSRYLEIWKDIDNRWTLELHGIAAILGGLMIIGAVFFLIGGVISMF